MDELELVEEAVMAGEAMFGGPVKEEKSFPVAAVSIAVVAVLVLAGVVIALGRKPAVASNVVQPVAAYADSLSVSDVVMSESTSLSGGKSTYMDGKITNQGPKTVAGVTVQVLFANDGGMPPQVETLPVTLIRTREPYVDTEPVSAAPIAPGATAEFRLIFENVADNWNQQVPEIRAIGVVTK